MVNASENCWDNCPSEIFLLIFKYLDIKSLLNCMTVNKRWFALVSSIANNIGWENMVKLGFSDKGASFRKKSNLGFQDMIINRCLWQNLKVANPVCKSNVILPDVVVNIRVYKGNLTIINSRDVRICNLDTQSEVKGVAASSYADLDENDYMIAALQKCDYLKILSLCPKQEPNSSWDDTNTQAFTVPLYKVHDDSCYVTTTDRCLFTLKWMNEIWDWKLLARHYGHGVIVDINFHQDDVFAMLNWGGLLRVDKTTLSFKKEFNFDIPKYSNPVLFQKYGAIIAVPTGSPFKFTRQDSEHWVFECPGLTSILEHGDMLFLGFEDGKVNIYEPQIIADPEPTPIISFYAQQQIGSSLVLEDPAVIKMEVRESVAAHDLFVATKSIVHQFRFVYPQSMREFVMEECR